jgi:hypothetical protein
MTWAALIRNVRLFEIGPPCLVHRSWPRISIVAHPGLTMRMEIRILCVSVLDSIVKSSMALDWHALGEVNSSPVHYRKFKIYDLTSRVIALRKKYARCLDLTSICCCWVRFQSETTSCAEHPMAVQLLPYLLLQRSHNKPRARVQLPPLNLPS